MIKEYVKQQYIKRAKDSLLHYVLLTEPTYRPSWFHSEIIGLLEQLERGDIRKLIITLPPQYGKSQLVSRSYPAWYAGRNPTDDIILASYGQHLSNRNSNSARRYVGSPEHLAVFGPQSQLVQGSKSKEQWETVSGNLVRSVGISGGLTGYGGELGVCDDMTRNKQDARSPVMVERLMEWYTNVFLTRMHEQGGKMLSVSTRWAENDLIGHQLETDGVFGPDNPDGWVLFDYPAIRTDENGREHALWPEKYPLEELHKRRIAVGADTWNCLYQCNPVPEGGTVFRKSWLEAAEQDSYPSDKQMKLMHFYGASDVAASGESTGDYTAHILGALDANGNLWILDLWKGQATADIWCAEMVNLMARYQTLEWAVESGTIWKVARHIFRKLQRERRVNNSTIDMPSVVDKVTRAISLRGLFNMGRVRIPRDAVWWPELKAELLAFPAGRHDDQVDAFTLLSRLLDKMRDEKREPEPKVEVVTSIQPFEERLIERDGEVIRQRPFQGRDLGPAHAMDRRKQFFET